MQFDCKRLHFVPAGYEESPLERTRRKAKLAMFVSILLTQTHAFLLIQG